MYCVLVEMKVIFLATSRGKKLILPVVQLVLLKAMGDQALSRCKPVKLSRKLKMSVDVVKIVRNSFSDALGFLIVK